VTRPGGTLLVVDQIASVDPLEAVALNAFERARDPSTTRVLSDQDLRGLFDSNGLVLRHEEFVHERRELEPYLDLAGCEGPERDRARALAPSGYEAEIGWSVLPRCPAASGASRQRSVRGPPRPARAPAPTRRVDTSAGRRSPSGCAPPRRAAAPRRATA